MERIFATNSSASLSRLFAMDDHGLWDLESREEKARSERQDQAWQDAASRAQTALDSLVSEKGAGGENVLEQLSISARYTFSEAKEAVV